jgi:hypothetical protein
MTYAPDFPGFSSLGIGEKEDNTTTANNNVVFMLDIFLAIYYFPPCPNIRK